MHQNPFSAAATEALGGRATLNGRTIPEKLNEYIFNVQSTFEYRTNPVFEWSILASPGHLNTGPFENRTNLSGFRMVH